MKLYFSVCCDANYRNKNKNTKNVGDLPKFTFSFLSWDLDNARFVYNSSSAITLFHYPNDPRLVSFLFFDVFAIRSSLFSW